MDSENRLWNRPLQLMKTVVANFLCMPTSYGESESENSTNGVNDAIAVAGISLPQQAVNSTSKQFFV